MSTAGLQGNLRLVCASDASSRTYLKEQSFSAPIHLSKAYWDGNVLLVHVINQTAGIFGGDRIITHVVVEPGANVLLTSPSAARFHPSSGRPSVLEQTLDIRAGGFLEVFPEISIPQRESISRQKTAIRIEPGGELIFVEMIAPGRVASGEVVAFKEYAWQTDITVAGQAILRERACLEPSRQDTLAGLQAFFHGSYYASIVVVSASVAQLGEEFRHAVAHLSNPDVHCAATRLNHAGYSIRVLARDSLALRHAIRLLRELIYVSLKRPFPHNRAESKVH